MASSVCGFAPCSAPFDARKSSHKYCSEKCKNGHNNERRRQGLKLLAAAMAAPLELMGGVMISSTAMSS